MTSKDGRKYRALLPVQYHRRCLYCGDPAQHRDHFVPWSANHSAWWVPACASCNLLLAGAQQETWGERLAYVQDRLTARYGRVLETDVARAMEGTGGLLRRALQGALDQQAAVAVRVAWAYAMEEMLGEIPLGAVNKESREVLTSAVHALSLP